MDEMVRLRDGITESMEAGKSLEQMEEVIADSGLGAAATALGETYDGPATPQDNSVQQLSDVMGAVREHEGQTNARWRRRSEDEQLCRRVRQALAS
jgi:hypothetical protein